MIRNNSSRCAQVKLICISFPQLNMWTSLSLLHHLNRTHRALTLSHSFSILSPTRSFISHTLILFYHVQKSIFFLARLYLLTSPPSTPYPPNHCIEFPTLTPSRLQSDLFFHLALKPFLNHSLNPQPLPFCSCVNKVPLLWFHRNVSV